MYIFPKPYINTHTRPMHACSTTRTPLIYSFTTVAGLKFSKFSHDTGSLNEEALDELTHQLLANKSINQWIIPDFIERDIYKNCLRLVFRLIDKVANTISIRLCGHELSLSE